MKKRTLLISTSLALTLGLCGCSVEVTTTEDDAAQEQQASEQAEQPQETEAAEKAAEPVKEEPEPTPLAIGETTQSNQFSITLASAYASNTLQSNQSSVYWTPQEGTVFVVLEFDVSALTSDHLPVDQYAISDLTANYNGNTYQNWEMKYVANQIWMPIMNTYLEANIPAHLYVYTAVPAEALNSGSLSIDLSLAGEPRTIVVR